MNRIGIVVLGAMLAAPLCYRQSSTPSPAPGAAAPVGHGAFPVKIIKTLDSSKLKEGDTVEVETAGTFKLPDGTLVSKGSKLTGHVTAAKARSKGDPESELTITFDKLNIANRKQLSIKGMVQAVFPPPDQADPGIPASTMARGGDLHTSIPTPEYQPPDMKTGSNTSTSSKQNSNMTPASVGVQGMHGLELKDGVITSTGKNVKLGDGVRMIVHVDIFG
jgi:hypothetical protein